MYVMLILRENNGEAVHSKVKVKVCPVPDLDAMPTQP